MTIIILSCEDGYLIKRDGKKALQDYLIAGEPIAFPCDVSSVGIKYYDLPSNLIPPTTINGKTIIGYMDKTATYRVAVLGVGNDRIIYYVNTTSSSAINGFVIPIYK